MQPAPYWTLLALTTAALCSPYIQLHQSHTALHQSFLGLSWAHDSIGGCRRQASTPVATSAPKAAAMASIAALELMSSGAGPLKAIASASSTASRRLEPCLAAYP